jgi:hypothetical protein
MKTYKGRYKPNPDKYDGDPTKVIYRSGWEKFAFMWCDANESVQQWSSETTVIPYVYDVDRRVHSYYMDLKIKYRSGVTMLVEIKPASQTAAPKNSNTRTKRHITESLTYVKNINKWTAASEYAKDRGWKFEIWTEHELTAMGILPKANQKMPGKLKPLKPYKPFKKKAQGKRPKKVSTNKYK